MTIKARRRGNNKKLQGERYEARQRARYMKALERTIAQIQDEEETPTQRIQLLRGER
ncbi:hypothetical protein MCCARTNEY_100 [Bacillus phage vB_BanH_McCartney]|nr:hypothetical protein MCCARTNEY_100 [Bacillus phage vB_BanH_McCartney]